MIRSFRNAGAEDIFNGKNTPAARRACSQRLWKVAGRKLDQLNEIVNGKHGITPSTALRLAKFFGTMPDFWMNLQLRWDLYWTLQEEHTVLNSIETRDAASIRA